MSVSRFSTLVIGVCSAALGVTLPATAQVSAPAGGEGVTQEARPLDARVSYFGGGDCNAGVHHAQLTGDRLAVDFGEYSMELRPKDGVLKARSQCVGRVSATPRPHEALAVVAVDLGADYILSEGTRFDHTMTVSGDDDRTFSLGDYVNGPENGHLTTKVNLSPPALMWSGCGKELNVRLNHVSTLDRPTSTTSPVVTGEARFRTMSLRFVAKQCPAQPQS